jgi:hypothetical protein
MVPEADDTSKSGAVVCEAKGGGWRLEVEYDQRKSVGRMCGWAKLLIRPTKKNMVDSMRWTRKIEGILASQNGKEKGNKNREGFLGY